MNIPIPVSNTNLTVYACRKTRLMGSFNIGSEFDKCLDCQIVFETGEQIKFEATLMEKWKIWQCEHTFKEREMILIFEIDNCYRILPL